MPELARILRARGEDAVSAHEAGKLGIADSDQLAYATELGRAIVTSNAADFIRLAREWFDLGRPHAGIIVPYRQISRPELGETMRAVLRLLTAVDAESLYNTVHVVDSYR